MVYTFPFMNYFKARGDQEAAVFPGGQRVTYGWLHKEIESFISYGSTLKRPSVVRLTPDDIMTVPRFFAVTDCPGLAVVVADPNRREWKELGGELINSKMVLDLLSAGGTGLLLFTSGTTGKPKAVLHDMKRFALKYERPGYAMRTVVFFPLDTVSGVDTMLYTLLNGGVAIFPGSMRINDVCSAVEKYRAEVLPVSPTFLTMLILSGAHKDFDMSSLKIVTCGSEIVDPGVIDAFRELYPGVTVKQKFGMTEVGALRTVTNPDNPELIKIEGDGLTTKVVLDPDTGDKFLVIKSRTMMLGYVCPDEPVSEWLSTGDKVETHGEWLRVVGRRAPVVRAKWGM